MTLVGWLWSLFSRPDAFAGRPWGHVGNQVGHAAVGAGLCLALGPVPALALYALWEIGQMVRFGSTPADSAEDAAFVCTGVVAALGWPAALLPAALHLLSGALERR